MITVTAEIVPRASPHHAPSPDTMEAITEAYKNYYPHGDGAPGDRDHPQRPRRWLDENPLKAHEALPAHSHDEAQLQAQTSKQMWSKHPFMQTGKVGMVMSGGDGTHLLSKAAASKKAEREARWAFVVRREREEAEAKGYRKGREEWKPVADDAEQRANIAERRLREAEKCVKEWRGRAQEAERRLDEAVRRAQAAERIADEWKAYTDVAELRTYDVERRLDEAERRTCDVARVEARGGRGLPIQPGNTPAW